MMTLFPSNAQSAMLSSLMITYSIILSQYAIVKKKSYNIRFQNK